MRLSREAIAMRRAVRRLRVGLVVDNMDWHTHALTRALTDLGATSMPIRLTACGCASSDAAALAVVGVGDDMPGALCVGTMPGGSFEAVTLRLGILHAARDLGVMVWNDARAIERCVDKSMTSFLLARAGIATPPTWAVESREAAAAIVAQEAFDGPLVLK